MREVLHSRAGAIFAASLIALVGLALADLVVMDAAQAGQVYVGGSTTATRSAVYQVHRPQLEVGDTVTVDLIRFDEGPLGRGTLYIVEAGEGDLFRTGGRPQHVYVEEAAAQPSPCCPDRLRVHFERPTPPPGVAANSIDVVWVLPYADDAPLPATDEGWRYFQEWAETTAVGTSNMPVVVKAYGPTFHGVATVAMLALAVVGLVAGVAWARGALRGPGAPEEGAETASLISLVETGQRWLASLRALLVGLGPPLLFGGWVTAAFFFGQTAELRGASANWGRPIELALWFAWLAAALTWGLYAWRVHRSLQRWRTEAGAPPELS